MAGSCSYADSQSTLNYFSNYTEHYSCSLARSFALIRKLDEEYARNTETLRELISLYTSFPSLSVADRPDPKSLCKRIARALDYSLHCRHSAFAEAVRLHEVSVRNSARLTTTRKKLQEIRTTPQAEVASPPFSESSPAREDKNRTLSSTQKPDIPRNGSRSVDRKRKNVSVASASLAPSLPSASWSETGPGSPIQALDDPAPESAGYAILSQSKEGNSGHECKILRKRRRSSSVPCGGDERPAKASTTHKPGSVDGNDLKSGDLPKQEGQSPAAQKAPSEVLCQDEAEPWLGLSDDEMALAKKKIKSSMWLPSHSRTSGEVKKNARGVENLRRAKRINIERSASFPREHGKKSVNEDRPETGSDSESDTFSDSERGSSVPTINPNLVKGTSNRQADSPQRDRHRVAPFEVESRGEHEGISSRTTRRNKRGHQRDSRLRSLAECHSNSHQAEEKTCPDCSRPGRTPGPSGTRGVARGAHERKVGTGHSESGPIKPQSNHGEAFQKSGSDQRRSGTPPSDLQDFPAPSNLANESEDGETLKLTQTNSSSLSLSPPSVSSALSSSRSPSLDTAILPPSGGITSPQSDVGATLPPDRQKALGQSSSRNPATGTVPIITAALTRPRRPASNKPKYPARISSQNTDDHGDSLGPKPKARDTRQHKAGDRRSDLRGRTSSDHSICRSRAIKPAQSRVSSGPPHSSRVAEGLATDSEHASKRENGEMFQVSPVDSNPGPVTWVKNRKTCHQTGSCSSSNPPKENKFNPSRGRCCNKSGTKPEFGSDNGTPASRTSERLQILAATARSLPHDSAKPAPSQTMSKPHSGSKPASEDARERSLRKEPSKRALGGPNGVGIEGKSTLVLAGRTHLFRDSGGTTGGEGGPKQTRRGNKNSGIGNGPGGGKLAIPGGATNSCCLNPVSTSPSSLSTVSMKSALSCPSSLTASCAPSVQPSSSSSSCFGSNCGTDARSGTSEEGVLRPGLRDKANVPTSDDPTEPRYCICGDVSWGLMIACENKTCEKEWFHLPCVNLETIPPKRSKWYCHECRESLRLTTPEEEAAD